jgi:hypothetical protein
MLLRGQGVLELDDTEGEEAGGDEENECHDGVSWFVLKLL